MKMKRTVGLLLILALLCGGCSLMLQSGLTAGNSQRIESAHGFAFRVPSDWLKRLMQNMCSTVFTAQRKIFI